MSWAKDSPEMKTYFLLIKLCKENKIDSVTISDAVRSVRGIWGDQHRKRIEDTYGRSPGMESLPDVQMLNAMRKKEAPNDVTP